MERRLAAILAADIAGYSALVGADEEGTVRAYKGHLSALEPIIGLNGGRVVKWTGDGFLAEFASVVDAVSGAAAMQRLMAERNGAQPEGKRLEFRMGVHVGDIIVDGEDILGDDVNIAARLESVAPPGGVAISGRVYEDIANKLDLELVDLGARELKNIARPVHIYSVAINSHGEEPQTRTLPDNPSVAVLAFENMSSDPEHEYFADGITEDIITGLSRVPWIFVIARNSSFSYKGLAVDVRRIGRELGVRYILEGSVRRGGNRLRVTGQLVEAENGNHLWADRYDGALEDVFELQDRITEAVVNAIAPQIREAEIARATRERPDSLTAYDLYLRALAALNRIQVPEASALLDEAIAATSGYAKAQAVRAWCYTLFSWRGIAPTDEDCTNAIKLAETALASADSGPEVWAYSGYTIAFFGDNVERGKSLVDGATQQCPSFAWAWASAAMLEYLYGDPERALVRAEKALRLSPRDPQAFRISIILSGCHRLLHNYDQAIEHARDGLNQNPKVVDFHITQIACLTWLKRLNEAAAAVQKLLVANPGFQVSAYLGGVQRFRGYGTDLANALRTAGVPD